MSDINQKFIEKCKNKYGNLYDYSKTNYINSKTKVEIICDKHGSFWINPSNFLCKDTGCPICIHDRMKSKKRIPWNNFLERCKAVHGDKYDYSKVIYTKSIDPIVVICPKHGEFAVTVIRHWNGYGCPTCYKEKANKIRQEKYGKLFVDRASKIHDGKYDYSKVQYVRAIDKVTIVCPEHGEFQQDPHSHLGGFGCPTCGKEYLSHLFRSNKEEFVTKGAKMHFNKYDYCKVEYKNSSTKICIICPEHGEFWQTPSDHLAGCGCPQCRLKSQSWLLKKLNNSFPEENFIWEYKADWLEKQRLDICLEKYKIGIEYDGHQHFSSIDFFGGEERFQKQLEEDALKNKKCKENGFTLFRVKYDYTDEDFYELCIKIKEIILNYTKDEGGLINE